MCEQSIQHTMVAYDNIREGCRLARSSRRSPVVGIIWLTLLSSSNAFVPNSIKFWSICSTEKSFTLFMSSIGGDNGGGRKKGDDENPLNKWIQKEGSSDDDIDSENRLPISYAYGAMNLDDEDDEQMSSEMGQFGPITGNTTSSSGLARSSDENKPARTNPYLNVVSRLTPSDLISRFTETASPRVQDAVRTTILGLIGGLPQMAFETKTVATGERLASLMFQLQMTGYMFKNAEYRMSLSQSLESSALLLPSDTKREWRDGVAGVKGKIKVRYGGISAADEVTADQTSTNTTATATMDREVSSLKTPGLEVEVDAETYMTELRTEVARLRDELEEKKLEREEEIRKDLLLYIRTLPPKELKALTGTMSPEVLDAMKGLVTAVLAGIGGEEDGSEPGISPNTVTEQSGESLAELCMWQLVVGFNLRELEVREELKSSLKGVLGDGSVSDLDENNSVNFEPGAFE